VIDIDVKLTSQIERFASQTKIMDVDDDDEYTNAAAAHAAFVAARMYGLLRHPHHARDINIHKLQPLPEKKSAWALPIFCTLEHPFYGLKFVETD